MLYNFDIDSIDRGWQSGCLQGYVSENYHTLVSVFGEPDHVDPSGDGKVNTEWELMFTVSERDFAGEPVQRRVYATIYDWKDYDGGERSRNSLSYDWHIGGSSTEAVDCVKRAIENHQLVSA